MKYLIVIIISSFLATTLFANKEVKCKQAMKHVIDVTMLSPQMKPMLKDPKMVKQLRASMTKQLKSTLKKCIEKFDENEYKCIMKSTKIEDMTKCKTKGKADKTYDKADNKKVNKCKSAIMHVYNLTLESPKMKPMLKDPKIAEQLKASMKYQMKQGLGKCVDKFSEESYKCLMKTTKFEDLTKCKKK